MQSVNHSFWSAYFLCSFTFLDKTLDKKLLEFSALFERDSVFENGSFQKSLKTKHENPIRKNKIS